MILSAYSACIRHVGSFHELATTPIAQGVNAVYWERSLPGHYGEVVRLLGDGGGEAITTLDEAVLLDLPLRPAIQKASLEPFAAIVAGLKS